VGEANKFPPGFERTPWFALADLACVFIGGAIAFAGSQISWQTGLATSLACVAAGIALALLPWLLRLVRGLSPFQPTPFDLVMALFLFSALTGVWAAYDRQAALGKFCLLLISILLFYALAAQPGGNLWVILGLLSLFGVGLSVSFFLLYDWQELPADVNFINQVGSWWANHRPGIPSAWGFFAVKPLFDILHADSSATHPLNANIAGGMLAIVFPLTLALFVKSRRGANKAGFALTFIALLVQSIALVFTSSRAAWAALALALSGWLLWKVSLRATKKSHTNCRVLLGLGLFLLIGLLIWWVSSPARITATLSFLPGLDSTGSRNELVRNTWKIIQDFPFTGVGLEAFSAHYSYYLLVIPFFYYAYSHNLYLSLLVEQGVLAGVSFLFVFFGSYLLLIKGPIYLLQLNLLKQALIASAAVLMLHGLLDDPLYSSMNAVFLFLLPGMALATIQADQEAPKLPARQKAFNAAIVVLLSVILIVLVGSPFISQWTASQVALRMARVQLAGFPTGEFDPGRPSPKIIAAEESFQEILTTDPGNRTAWHRLGLVALQRRDFPQAVKYLESAYELDPQHRGIQKNLGFAYAWNGDSEKAARLLQSFPEARRELRIYAQWWQDQERSDLAMAALATIQKLVQEASTSQSP
jgi:tetratricopeptide (TPR) repeat protein